MITYDRLIDLLSNEQILSVVDQWFSYLKSIILYVTNELQELENYNAYDKEKLASLKVIAELKKLTINNH